MSSITPNKPNVVADALSRLTMRSVTHNDESKKDLAKIVYRCARLRVRFNNSPNGSAIVYHNSKSSLVVDVKSKQHLDLALMEFK